MRKTILLLLGVSSLLACSKDDNQNNTSDADKCHIYEVNGWHAGTHRINFEYDGQGRTNKIVENFSETVEHNSSTTFQFTYGNDNIRISQQVDLSSGVPTIARTERTFFLENGKITKATQANWVKHYTYNTDGYLNLITIVINGNEYFTKMNYDNGNLHSINDSDHPYDYLVTYNALERLPYTEFISVDYTFGEWFFEDIGEAALYEQGYFGKKIKNQITSIRYGDREEIFTYTNDSNGKPKSFSTTNNNSESTTFYDYEKHCN